MPLKLIYIADCKHKGNDICVFRDQHGKYHIKVNGVTTQKGLLANAIVRWFCGAMHEELKKPIPKNVYFRYGNFYNRTSRVGLGNKFYKEWKERAFEFPGTPYN